MGREESYPALVTELENPAAGRLTVAKVPQNHSNSYN